ncbi:hypothetical protein BJX99DRAFT_230505 [Aspergillus californicus]
MSLLIIIALLVIVVRLIDSQSVYYSCKYTLYVARSIRRYYAQLLNDLIHGYISPTPWYAMANGKAESLLIEAIDCTSSSASAPCA